MTMTATRRYPNRPASPQTAAADVEKLLADRQPDFAQLTDVVTTDQLAWFAEGHLFTGDASNIPFGTIRLFDIGEHEQLGFRFKSAKTGREVLMVEHDREVFEGELTWIDYVPLHAADRAALAFTVRLYED